MKLTREQLPELKAAAKPLIDFLREHGNPHCEANVTPYGVEVFEGVASVPVNWEETKKLGEFHTRKPE